MSLTPVAKHLPRRQRSITLGTAVVLAVFSTLSLTTHAQEKEATALKLEVIASPTVNPNDTGRPSPIRVRIYELKDSASFREADYFSLESDDKVVLAADMLARDEFILRPREKRKIQRKSNPATTAIGVLAGYRDLAHTTWRVVIPLEDPPEKSWWRFAIPANALERAIKLDPQGVRIDPLQ